MTSWDNLPTDVIKIILNYRKIFMYKKPAIIKIQSLWNSYKIRKLIHRFKMLRYLKDFRKWNPTIQDFLLRSRL